MLMLVEAVLISPNFRLGRINSSEVLLRSNDAPGYTLSKNVWIQDKKVFARSSVTLSSARL